MELLKAPQNAPCVGKVDLFFPGSPRTITVIKNEREAKKICRSCDQQQACLEYAVHHEMYGIWGGTTESARVRLRQMRNIRLVSPQMVASQ